ncbi:class I SAM-dependent methyltransferase [Sphingomonas sp. M1-B02]|uniref:class I SAM-dependent methyltransferase n=1 Tax=Sphingomonas sp. M1-B02 TaxID=3114300 RepID=UPI00223F696F|nr:class I SAM-dependent methyltransferase [Sphingomonas sp. S6-11]UZK67581.1 class I SAM-dependent methyltransferase [Sphingomonas sp. S6-11]
MDDTDNALLCLSQALRSRGYGFVTPTPATHGRVVARPGRKRARVLTDVLGWSLPFEASLLDPEILTLLDRANGLERMDGALLRSRYRISSLKDGLYIHSAYPTEDEDAVFFGPDSYRFADLIEAELTRLPPRPGAAIVDIGTGSGVGAIVAAKLCPDATVAMTDVNPQALRLAAINARAAGVTARGVQGDDLRGIDGAIDVALANPPYIMDESDRTYRAGGGMHGGQVSFDMTRIAAERLAPGGRVILYTGSAIVDGGDGLKAALQRFAAQGGLALAYRELDPDVFGEELELPAYADVERIAVVAAILTKP